MVFLSQGLGKLEHTNKSDIRSLLHSELEEIIINMGHKRYRADQIFDWLHKKRVENYGEMSNIPAALINELSEDFMIYPVTKELVKSSELDGTKKYLFRLYDGNIIESVLMRYEHGNSVCVSSQAGCRMGCRFCASTIEGLARNLTAGEMLGQVYGIIKDTGERVSNVVIMGSGEPLDNYESSVSFIRLLNSESGLNISQRNITLSTCGILEGIKRLKEENLSITLAVSLHAAFDEKRRELMPIADSYAIDELIEACRDYYEGRNRRLTFEYSLIKGFNDGNEDADRLSELLYGLNAHVNLIPVNPVRKEPDTGGDHETAEQKGTENRTARGIILREPEAAEVRAFQNKLDKNHINVTIRRELGRDIDGACGQLRRHYLNSF
ncbi:MAG: 23S rRNA (adenine(2503)-C(2))-methyltransferase RlmN [Lachnospiraceae bacterium]|nr:23S rRNA (adenine(2503)-C(2))-methyltransferase RlmN [Lachnospiraceae bacterium]